MRIHAEKNFERIKNTSKYSETPNTHKIHLNAKVFGISGKLAAIIKKCVYCTHTHTHIIYGAGNFLFVVFLIFSVKSLNIYIQAPNAENYDLSWISLQFTASSFLCEFLILENGIREDVELHEIQLDCIYQKRLRVSLHLCQSQQSTQLNWIYMSFQTNFDRFSLNRRSTNM